MLGVNLNLLLPICFTVMDIDYEYEPKLELNGEIRRPDFVIYDDSIKPITGNI